MTFEDLYNAEMEQRERIQASIGMPVGLLVVIAGLLGLMIQSSWFERRFLCVWFWLFAFATAGVYSRAVYFLARVYLGHRYRMTPFACEQRDYKIKLRAWYVRQGRNPEEGDKDYAAWIDSKYAETADFNARSNYDKREYLFRANKAVVTCLILAVLTFLPFAVHRMNTPPAVQKVQIVKS